MKTIRFLIFVTLLCSLNLFGQNKDFYTIFDSNHFTVSVETIKGEKVYSFSKQNNMWIMDYSKRSNTHNTSLHHIRKKKVFWDNFYSLKLNLYKNAYDYYNEHKQYGSPINKDVCYKVTDGKDSVMFNAQYVNIQKALNHIGWTNNSCGRRPSFHPDYRKQ